MNYSAVVGLAFGTPASLRVLRAGAGRSDLTGASAIASGENNSTWIAFRRSTASCLLSTIKSASMINCALNGLADLAASAALFASDRLRPVSSIFFCNCRWASET